jgi:hypothetical protein
LEALGERLAAVEREMHSLRRWLQARFKEDTLLDAGAAGEVRED